MRRTNEQQGFVAAIPMCTTRFQRTGLCRAGGAWCPAFGPSTSFATPCLAMPQPARTVPLVNLAADVAFHRAAVTSALSASLDSASFILGPAVARVEAELAAFAG
eukprot:CAMPEP_0174895652 /NCGR_PEP_ID=MMETSP0167-20121228/10015_1 /TAXON_ID=38298 /ORGANISM="Rhodella maculata, Strain CCMP736" /LENGTH=104 /DNA_ID=CAMNT_0016135035 /DNA_START=279 /DNA_END=589 /DNA_ORIENTATION=-